jgi:predicted dehydrogenase
MPQRLRGAIAGCGFFAQFQIEAWRRMEDVELCAACDPRIERAQSAAPHAYTAAEEMLDRETPDFLDIATRPDSHLPLLRLAIERGIPVICQKPMAPCWRDAVEMVEAADAAEVPFMVHENWRWQPWFREVDRRIEAGDIGVPLAYSFRVRKNDGGGSSPYPAQPYFSEMPRLLIYETLVHQLDTARFLFGDIGCVSARARRRNPIIAGEDQALLIVTHEDGLPGSIDGHRFLDLVPDSPVLGDAAFEGESGMLYVSPSGDVLLNGSSVCRFTDVPGYRGDSVYATQKHFVENLRLGRQFESSGREYLKTFAAVEAAYRSIELGRTVSVSEFLPHGAQPSRLSHERKGL